MEEKTRKRNSNLSSDIIFNGSNNKTSPSLLTEIKQEPLEFSLSLERSDSETELEEVKPDAGSCDIKFEIASDGDDSDGPTPPKQRKENQSDVSHCILEESDDDFYRDTEDDFFPSPMNDDIAISDIEENSSSDNDEGLPLSDSMQSQWCEVTGENQRKYSFTGFEGSPNMMPSTAFEAFSQFLDDEVLNLLVTETNKSGHKQRPNWKETTASEMKKFLGLIAYFGLVPYPALRKYWSGDKLYANEFVRSIMTRNRFHEILKEIHFSQEENYTGDRLAKVRDLINLMNDKFAACRTPGENVVIDETMVPFRGRLCFRQCLPGKSNKCGIKLFKACGTDGYTYRFQVYAGKNDEEKSQKTERHSNVVVYELLQNYMEEGRTLVVDNFYTNLDLASKLLKKKTHLVGTLRRFSKDIPKELLEPKIKRGQVIGKENAEGIVVGTWRDTRLVHFLSTRHTLNMTATGKKNRKGEEVLKPELINFYNKRKQGVDLSDQMSSYFLPLRKTVRWFHKVGFFVILGTAVVNAFILFKKNDPNIRTSTFREALVASLTSGDDEADDCSPQTKKLRLHKLEKTEKKDVRNRRIRRRCGNCYKVLKASLGRAEAAKKTLCVNTQCMQCPKQPFMCLVCFNNHTN